MALLERQSEGALVESAPESLATVGDDRAPVPAEAPRSPAPAEVSR
jgi:hypothetical protein